MDKNSCPYLDNSPTGICKFSDWEICPYWFKGCPYALEV